MRVWLDRAHHPVTALGPGRRVGLWLQGCSIGCRGCISQDTWSRGPGSDVDVADLVDWVRAVDDGVDGVTISGGEPFDQAEALQELLLSLHGWRAQTGREVDLLAYSGYSTAVLRRRHPEVLRHLDAAITGPYLASRPTTLLWRGSANQELLPLSDLGRRRYGHLLTAESSDPPLQGVVSGGSIWYVGVPRDGDMDRLDAALRRRGVVQEEVSWRS